MRYEPLVLGKRPFHEKASYGQSVTATAAEQAPLRKPDDVIVYARLPCLSAWSRGTSSRSFAHFTRNQTNRQLCSPWGTRPRSWANRSLGRALRPVVQALRVRFLRAGDCIKCATASLLWRGDCRMRRQVLRPPLYGHDMGTTGREAHAGGRHRDARRARSFLTGKAQVQWRGVARRRRLRTVRALDVCLPAFTGIRSAAPGDCGFRGEDRRWRRCLVCLRFALSSVVCGKYCGDAIVERR